MLVRRKQNWSPFGLERNRYSTNRYASFDIGFLRHEFALLGMSLNNRSLCTLKMSRKQYPHLPNHKFETVSRYLLGKSCMRMQRHRALDDAKLAVMIWLEMGKM